MYSAHMYTCITYISMICYRVVITEKQRYVCMYVCMYVCKQMCYCVVVGEWGTVWLKVEFNHLEFPSYCHAHVCTSVAWPAS